MKRGIYRSRYPCEMRADPFERLLRGLYSAALYLLLPVTLYHLVWRGFRQGEYLLRWNERYGIYGDAPQPADIWVHAVSMGEVNAAAPLINALRERHPGLRLLVTSITPTGSARIRTRSWRAATSSTTRRARSGARASCSRSRRS